MGIYLKGGERDQKGDKTDVCMCMCGGKQLPIGQNREEVGNTSPLDNFYEKSFRGFSVVLTFLSVY